MSRLWLPNMPPSKQRASVLPAKDEKDPSQDIRGMPPNFGKAALPHVLTFQGIISSIARVYRPSDEALKDSYENARFMRNDVAIMECLEQRKRSCALLDWHLEPEDENDLEQKGVCEELTRIIQNIPRFMQYRECLLEALWYGKYGVQHRFSWKILKRGGPPRLTIDRWLPVNGDKLVFRFDDGTYRYDPDQVGVRVGAGFTMGDTVAKEWPIERKNKVQPTDWGLAYFLDAWERPLLAIHKHQIEDGEYEEPQHAGRIHGLGIRSRIYWTWYQKQEALAWLMEYLERSGFGVEIWYYPWGNEEAKKATREAAEERIGQGRNIVLVPKPIGEDSHAFGVERLEPGMSGADVLKDILVNYFGHLIKRYILGQTLTSEAESTGLGSNLATIHLDTYLQIIKYDAINLGETLTTDLVDPLKEFNFPQLADVPIKFIIETEAPDVEAKLAAWKQAYEMGCKFREQDVMDLVGASIPDPDEPVLQQQEAPSGGLFGNSPDMPYDGNGKGVPEALSRYGKGFDESEHPRDEEGQFSEKEGGGVTAGPSSERPHRITKEEVEESPWEYTANQFQFAHSVDQPWIGEISSPQFAGLSKRGKGAYEEKRRQEWQASMDIKAEWRQKVIGAYEGGEIDLDTANLHPDAKGVIVRHRIKAKEREEEKTRQEARKSREIGAVSELKAGDLIDSPLYGKRLKVIKVNPKSIKIEGNFGSPITLKAAEVTRFVTHSEEGPVTDSQLPAPEETADNDGT